MGAIFSSTFHAGGFVGVGLKMGNILPNAPIDTGWAVPMMLDALIYAFG